MAMISCDMRYGPREDGPLQLSLFDERDLAEITSPDFPGERLIVCRNREQAKERARKREALLVATERELARVQVRRGLLVVCPVDRALQNRDFCAGK